MSIVFEKTAIAGVFIIRSIRRGDERGAFMRLFCETTCAEQTGRPFNIRQVNFSASSQRGTVRGLHYQNKPALEGKVVRCLQGRIYDVAVDLRRGSPTFKQHVAIELNPDDAIALLIPPGCAHGFQTLEDDCEMLYLHSADYSPADEAGIAFDDPALAIEWPLHVTVISERDRALLRIQPDFSGVDDEV